MPILRLNLAYFSINGGDTLIHQLFARRPRNLITDQENGIGCLLSYLRKIKL